MKFTPTAIPDVVLITPQLFGDSRGFFMETYHQQKYREAGIEVNFVQTNHSRSVRHTLRGLHYQIQQPQGKLVQVIRGEVFDVAVDMRRSSPTFGQWVGEILSEENRRQLWVPAGFAHGFLVLSEVAEFTYQCTDLYAPPFERSLIWNDPTVAVAWPLAEGVQPLLSAKDERGLPLAAAEPFA